ncbi:cytochrome b5-related protein-like [Trichoplusia ni]|uniref:Cytochrome b5-related protein n=1 Tax=Trichoplusia ni TaxID=7111 RepID=A0A7E5W976_TRINI|nr:cytochrome b5-related protein-like [Trichoplusia ni]
MAPKELDYIEWANQKAAEKKTHISFPQLKYPSLRDGGFRDAIQWLEGKALDDGAEGLWRVYDGIYDFTDFQNKHPGGEEWFELSKGTDITEAFESHHLNPVVEKMLDKYFIKKAKTPRNSPFTFKEDGFYKTIKRAVWEELKKIPKSDAKKTNMIIDGLLITLLIASAVACWSTNYWVVMVSYLIAGLSLGWITIAAHNYVHMKTNWRMYLFNLSLWSYRDFRVSHALSHHLFTNTLMDLEISAAEPFLLWNPRKKPFYTNLSLIIEIVVFPLYFIMNFMKRFISNFVRKDFFIRHYKWHDGIGFLLPLWMYIVSGATLYQVVVMWLWIVCTGSLIFSVIGTNAAHHHPNIFKDGDQLREKTIDWGMHELEAVMDRTDITGSHFKVLTFFGDHALHHLFPTLDHGILKHLYPVFLEHCEKFKANFRMTSSFDLFIGQLKMTVKETPNVLKDSK